MTSAELDALLPTVLERAFKGGTNTTHATVLFDTPQNEIASRINQLLDSSTGVSIVSGFLTKEGIKLMADPIQRNPKILQNLVVGAGTLHAFEAIDELIRLGVPKDRIFINLGFSRLSTGKYPFIKYHPMLHSKVYYFEKENSIASAIIGSHNITGFALSGQNGEASVLLEGRWDEQPFIDIRNHISKSIQNSVTYDSLMKEAYAWWARQFIEGLQSKMYHEEKHDDVENERTIVVFSVQSNSADMPKPNDTIYLDVPEAFRILRSLNDPVHFYIMPKMPNSPEEAIRLSMDYKVAFKASVIGTNMYKRVEKGRTDWFIRDIRNPVIARAPTPFNPSPHPNEIQVFLLLQNPLIMRYEYRFYRDNIEWKPVFDEKEKTKLNEKHAMILKELKLIPPEHLPWQRVKGLFPSEKQLSPAYEKAIDETSPKAGIYVLYSRSRIKIERKF